MNHAYRPLAAHTIRWTSRLILVAYLVLGALYAARVPVGQFLAEDDHLAYVTHIAKRGRLPDPEPAQAQQPPLYHLLASLVYRLARGHGDAVLFLSLRAFSIVLGAGVLIMGYRLMRDTHTSEPILSLGMAAFVATLPWQLRLSTAVSNGILAQLLLVFLGQQLAIMSPDDWTHRRAFGLGALFGLSLLTGPGAPIAPALIIGALLWDTLHHHRLSLPVALRHATIVLGTGVVVGSPWLMRQATLGSPAGWLALRDGPDPLGPLLLDAGASVLGEPTARLALIAVAVSVVLGLGDHIVREIRDGAPMHGPQSRTRALLALWLLVAIAQTLLLYGELGWAPLVLRAVAPLGLAFTLGIRQALRTTTRLLVILAGLGLVGLLLAGLASGQIHGARIAALVVCALALAGGHWLERRRPGLPLAIAYLGMATLAVVALGA